SRGSPAASPSEPPSTRRRPRSPKHPRVSRPGDPPGRRARTPPRPSVSRPRGAPRPSGRRTGRGPSGHPRPPWDLGLSTGLAQHSEYPHAWHFTQPSSKTRGLPHSGHSGFRPFLGSSAASRDSFSNSMSVSHTPPSASNVSTGGGTPVF